MTEETELEEKTRQIERMNIELESLRATQYAKQLSGEK